MNTTATRRISRLLLLTSLLLVAGCDDGDEPGPATDTASTPDTDVDAADDTDAPQDGGPDTDGGDLDDVAPDSDGADTRTDDADALEDAPDLADTSPPDADVDPPDVTPDPSLEGTTLHAVGVRWDRALHLCTPWREGDNFQGDRFEVELAPKARGGLGQTVLGGATLEGPVLVATGAYLGERRWLGAPQVSSTLVDWQLEDPTGDTRLTASIAHTIDGVGVLTEHYAVRRTADQLGVPVESRDGLELTFEFVPDGGTPGPLEPCDGPADAETAVFVTAARHTDGRTITVLRLARQFLTFAGSSPVWVHGHALLRSDEPWQIATAAGPWTHRYQAAHHNWDDRTDVWFERDVANDAVWFDTGARPSPVVAGVRYVGLNGYDAPEASLEIDWLQPDDSRTTETWDPGALLRVDATHLSRGHAAACDGQPPEVFAAWGPVHLVQLVTCPDASQPAGVELVDVVPVVFPGELDAVGQPARVTGVDAVIDGTPAHLIEVGGHTVRVAGSTLGPLWLQLEVRDGAGAIVSAELVPALDLVDLWQRSPNPIVGQGDGVRVEIRRELAAGPAFGNSSFFAPSRVTVERDGQPPLLVDALDAMTYTNTHHNHGDTLTATTADGLTIEWAMTDIGAGQTVRIVRADGSELLPTTALVTQ